MPRPSLKAERRDQILDAYAACVARHGVDGATLERVAAEAGLARALIRHNIGNRDALQAALVARMIERSGREMAAMTALLPVRDRSRTMVRWLFDPAAIERSDVLVANALIVAAGRDAGLAAAMRTWIGGFCTSLRVVLAEEHPGSDASRLDAVAAGIMGLYFNTESATVLGGMDALRQDSLAAALLLVETLAVAA